MNNDNPKGIWKKSFKGRTALVVWLAVAIFTAMLGCFITALLNYNRPMSDWFTGVGILAGVLLAVCLVLIYIVWPLLHWLFWKHWRRTLFGLACFITLIALFYAEEDWRGKHDWDQFKHRWESKGEHFNFASVVPKPVPNDQNFAMAPVWVELIAADVGTNFAEQLYGRTVAPQELAKLSDRLQMNVGSWENCNHWPTNGNWETATLTDLKLWQDYYYALAAKTNEFPVTREPQTSAQVVLLALSIYDSTIEELREAACLPESRFPLDYDDENPADIPLPQLSVLRSCSQVLQLRAIAELQNGQGDEALADVKLALYLMNSVRTEPFLISHLVRIAMLQLTLQPIYEGLAKHEWSDSQLTELESELAKLNFPADYEFSMRGEVGFMPNELQYRRLTRDPGELYYDQYHHNENHPLDVKWAVFVYRHCPGGWFYQNQIWYCRFVIQNFLSVFDASRQLAFPASASRANTALQKEIAHPNPYNFIARKIVSRVDSEFTSVKLVQKFAWAQSSVDLARVAIALERYRLAHGEYPESLNTLAPQFIARLPHDIIGGQPSHGSGPASQPLHYRRTPDGQFVLYSVGWNETDDGGAVVLYKGSSDRVDISRGDWVWRYPQK